MAQVMNDEQKPTGTPKQCRRDINNNLQPTVTDTRTQCTRLRVAFGSVEQNNYNVFVGVRYFLAMSSGLLPSTSNTIETKHTLTDTTKVKMERHVQPARASVKMKTPAV